MNLYTPPAPVFTADEKPATTADAVIAAVTDDVLASWLLTASEQVPQVGRRIVTTSAEIAEVTRDLIALESVVSFVRLRKTYAVNEAAPGEIELPTSADNLPDQSTLTAYHLRALSSLLTERQACRDHFEAALEAWDELRPILHRLASALLTPAGNPIGLRLV